MTKRRPNAVRSRAADQKPFEMGLSLHRQGRLLDAEQMYEAQLRLLPNHLGALHNLGILLAQQGRLQEAEALIRKTVRQNPKFAEAFNTLGNILHQTQRYADASHAFGRAVALRPNYAEAHNNQGAALQALGRITQAVSSYEKAIVIAPTYSEAHRNLANALRTLDRKDEALAHFARSLAQRVKSPAVHSDFGNLLQELGRYGEAVDQYLASLAIGPGDAELYYNLATALLKLNRHQEALANYQRAVQIKPDYSEAHNNLGGLLLELGRAGEALLHLDKALAFDPSNPQAHCNRGQALLVLKRSAEAITAFQAALAIRPDHAEAHNNLGGALREVGHHDEAIGHFEAALKIRSEYGHASSNLNSLLRETGAESKVPAQAGAAADEAEIRYQLANVAGELGRSDVAREALEMAVELDPRRPIYYLALSDAKRFAPGDKHLAGMEALFEDIESLPVNEQIYLHFALGKALADVGEYERSFKHQLQANALHRQQFTYDEIDTLEKINRIGSLLTPGAIRSLSGVGDRSSLPIFIVGMPRSGTSLIEQILASHPQVFGAGELDILGRLVIAGTSNGITRDWLQGLGPDYVARIKALAPPSERITDKMPTNFLFVGLIHLALPNAKIIHARRNSVDTCLSCFSKLFAGEIKFAYDLGELGRYYRAYDRLMAHWRSALPEGTMLEVDYEEVVADLETQARRIVGYCGLEWSDACLEFHKAERSVRTASVMQVRQPIYRTSIGHWRPVAHLLKPLLDALEIHDAEASLGSPFVEPDLSTLESGAATFLTTIM